MQYLGHEGQNNARGVPVEVSVFGPDLVQNILLREGIRVVEIACQPNHTTSDTTIVILGLRDRRQCLL